MRERLLELLACPECAGDLTCEQEQRVGEEIEAGFLHCACGKTYPIRNGIPRFVPDDVYASSFGYQWNKFRLEQIDQREGEDSSFKRFWSETQWQADTLKGQWILDGGCGAGRFLEVASRKDANGNYGEIVGVDISRAIDAARKTLHNRPNVHLVQASLLQLPFKEGVFDRVYCIGVIQHTPDPHGVMRSLAKVLKYGGDIAVTIYEKRKWTLFNGKYMMRPLTKRLPQRFLLRLIQAGMPLGFASTEVLFRLPKIGRAAKWAIPIANWVENPDLSLRERYQWAILDTFDALSPAYDSPQSEAEATQVLAEAGIENLRRTSMPGLNLIGTRKRSE